ncbi:MAG: hypothetical protein M3217_12840 [Actinomycetota bacterium]|nr:hypothetical protein [Actinomycetota bacterium]
MRRVAALVLLLVFPSAAPARTQTAPPCPPWQVGQHLETGSRARAKALVHDFVRAYNRGDLERLDEIFPQEPGFEGYYTAPERTWERGEDRSTLIGYFERRHRLDDRLTLETLRVQRKRHERGWGFYFELRRSSDESRAEGFYAGKGAADCAMSLWNMTPQER